jgi:hypothetical protein
MLGIDANRLIHDEVWRGVQRVLNETGDTLPEGFTPVELVRAVIILA